MSYLDTLLEGVEVEWKTLGEVLTIKNGRDYKNFQTGNIPVYGSGGVMTFIDTPVYDKPSVLIPRKGSLGNLYYVDIPFWTVDTIFWTDINTIITTPKFVYYYLKTQHLEELNMAGGVPSLTQTILNKLPIPIPPLSVQEEIVRILDTFTELTAELAAEFTARKKQYEYYREQLFSFEEGAVEWKTLGDVGDVKMCKRILKHETDSEGDVPFYKIGTFGKQADAYISYEIYNLYTSRYSFPKKGDVLISASGTIGRTVIYNGEPAYFQDSNIVWIDNDESFVTNEYLWYFYQIAEWFVSGGGTIDRLYNDNIRKTKIPVPSLKEQARIVSILDKFDRLTTSLSEGLPKEIELRKKQYEYYRDMLLTF